MPYERESARRLLLREPHRGRGRGLGFFIALAVAACSSSPSGGPDGGGDSGPADAAGDSAGDDAPADAAQDGGGDGGCSIASAVSFKTQVYPVFQGTCGVSNACHNNPNGTRVYLGKATDSNASAVRTRIVNVMSTDDPMMAFVKPGDSTKSFLMHKMDDDLSSIASECGGDCGGSMPQGMTILDQCTRDTIRAWITQGAPDN